MCIRFSVGTYEEILGKLDLSEKARLPFVISVVLSVVLFVIVVLMIIFWPRIPDYMSAKVCVEKECLDASSQVNYLPLIVKMKTSDIV